MVHISWDNVAAQSWPWRALWSMARAPMMLVGYPPLGSLTSPMVLVGPPPSLLRLAPDLCIIGSYPYPWVHLLACPSQSWHLLASCCQVASASMAQAPWHQGWSPVLSDVARQHRLQILVPSATQCEAEGRWASSSGVRGTSSGILSSSG